MTAVRSKESVDNLNSTWVGSDGLVTFRRPLVSIGEIWFGKANRHWVELASVHSLDAVRFLQREAPIEGTAAQEYHTLILDLSKRPDQLLAKIHKTARYKIKRAAERDGLSHRCWSAPDLSAIRELCSFVGRFRMFSGLLPPEPGWLETYSRAGMLDLSVIVGQDREPLAWHCHYIGSGRARLLISSNARFGGSSEFRQLVGRANLLLHWCDILRFKENGIGLYDFGGWRRTDSDLRRSQVHRFKEQFGGDAEKSFNCEVGITLRGRLYLAFLGARKRTLDLRSRLRSRQQIANPEE